MYSAIAANKRNTVIMMAVFVGLVAAIGWLVSEYYLEAPSVTYWIVAAALLYVVIQYFAASKLMTGLMGAKEIQKRDNPRLYRIVENLAITTGMPTPRVYIIEDAAPNAFATGRDPNHAMVGVTTGLLEIMNDRELAAVMAHEIGHVQNYDIRVSLIAAGLASVISIIADAALRISWYGGNNRNNNGNAVMLIIGLAAIILAPIIASLIQLAIGRQREYLADASSVMITRDPDAMAGALSKLESHSQPMRRQSTTTAHLFMNNPLGKKSMRSLFSTHPPIEERIKRIKNNQSRM